MIEFQVRSAVTAYKANYEGDYALTQWKTLLTSTQIVRLADKGMGCTILDKPTVLKAEKEWKRSRMVSGKYSAVEIHSSWY